MGKIHFTFNLSRRVGVEGNLINYPHARTIAACWLKQILILGRIKNSCRMQKIKPNSNECSYVRKESTTKIRFN